jgi:heat shock protein HslJ
MRPAALAALAACIIVAVTGCTDDVDVFSEQGPGGPGSEVTSQQLDGRSFTGDDVTGHDLVSGTSVTLGFDGDRLSAGAGCNTTSAAYRLDGARLVVEGPGMSTLIGCPPELEAQDRWLNGFLADGPELRLDGEELTLTSADGDTAMTLSDGGRAASPLVGTTWTLASVLDGDTASSIPSGLEPPTIRIGEDGMAELFLGCNRGGAAAGTTTTEQGDVLTFGPIRTTRMACAEPASGLEATVLRVLESDPTYMITGNTMVLTAVDGTTLEYLAD